MDPSSHCDCLLRPDLQKNIRWNDIKWLEKIEHHLAKSDCPRKHPLPKDLVLETPVEGITPLLLACSAGKLEAVRHLVREWGADVNKAGTYLLDDKKIEGATPLFVAALKHSENIVRYLLENGANVSIRTFDSADVQHSNMTPLQAAVMCPKKDEMFEPDRQAQLAVIRMLLNQGADPSETRENEVPLWQFYSGFQQDNEVLEILVNAGMALDVQNPLRGNQTLLHTLIKDSCLEEPRPVDLIRLVLSKGADFRLIDDKGFTSLQLAALERLGNCGLPILRCFLDDSRITREEKIEVLELAGSTVLFNSHWFEKEEFNFWKEATTLRLEGETPIPKILPRAHSNTAIEWVTHEDLEKLKVTYSKWQIQSFLVRLRILSRVSVSYLVDYVFYNNYKFFCWGLWDERNYHELLDVVWAVLETFRQLEPDEGVSLCIVDMCYDTVGLLDVLRKKNHPLLNAHTILTTLQLILEVDSHILRFTGTKWCKTYFSRSRAPYFKGGILGRFEIIWLLLDIIASRPDLVSDTEIIGGLKQSVDRKDRDSGGRSLLHAVCSYLPLKYKLVDEETSGLPLSLEKNDEDIHEARIGLDDAEHIKLLPTVVTMMLQAGADPNAVDNYGNTPLHLLSSKAHGPVRREIVEMFKIAGCHLDVINDAGLTAMQIFDSIEKDAWSC